MASINVLTRLGFVLAGQVGLRKTAQTLGWWWMCVGGVGVGVLVLYQAERERNVWEVQPGFEILFTHKEIG